MTEITKQLIKPHSEAFNNRLKKVPFADYITTIIKLADHCGVSEHVIYNWRTGRTYIRKSDRAIIESYFNEKIF
ncbi:MAG: hypothetical protein RBT49_15560 [Bacteroidales bacterium]|jgi:hypothetical protein|nr:hypothetical protein [Bacteroidales bacterium]